MRLNLSWFSLIYIRISGKECLAWCDWLFRYGIDELDMNLMIKNYDFDKAVVFVNLIWLKSIDFTGVWVIFSLGFLIIYNMKFYGLSAIFWLSSMKALIYKGFDGFFGGIVVILRYF